MKTQALLIVLAVLMGSLTAWASEDAPTLDYKTVLKASDGGPDEPTELAIQSAKAWKEFIETCVSKEVRAKLKKRKIDFDNATIVVVAPGKNSSILGHPDYEKQAGVQSVERNEGKAVIHYNVVFSDHQDTRDRYPLHVIKFEKVKKVDFKQSQKAFAG